VNAGNTWTPYIAQGNRALFVVETNSSNVLIGVDKEVADSVLTGFTLKCAAGATLELEVSFYHVVNAEAIEIVVLYGNRITLKTDLVNLPPVSVSSESGELEVTVVTKQPIFTAKLAFWVFVGLMGVMGGISIVLCIVGQYCMPPEEEFDVSTDEESDGKSKKD
jgi:hypothetical protein